MLFPFFLHLVKGLFKSFSHLKNQVIFIVMKVKVTQSCQTLSDPMNYIVQDILRPEYWNAQSFLLQGIFPSQGSNSGLLKLQVDSLPAESQGKPKNTGVGSLFLLQGIFLAQESNLGLLQCRWIFFFLPIELSGKPLLSYKNIYTYILVYVYICICSGYYLLSSSSDMISKYFLPFISLFNAHTFLSLQSYLSVFLHLLPVLWCHIQIITVKPSVMELFLCLLLGVSKFQIFVLDLNFQISI